VTEAPPASSPERSFRWAELSENIPVGIYALQTRPDGTLAFLFASRCWLAMLDLELDALLGDPSLAFARVHPEEREAFTRLNAQRHELERKLRSSLTAAAMAHEIQQPLSTLLIGARLALSAFDQAAQPGSPALRHQLEIQLQQARQLQLTTEKMRSLLRNVQTPHHPVDLTQVVESSLLFLQRSLEQCAITPECAGLGRSIWIAGDGASCRWPSPTCCAMRSRHFRTPRCRIPASGSRWGGSGGWWSSALTTTGLDSPPAPWRRFPW
jgi:signal transduction histidine kinase